MEPKVIGGGYMQAPWPLLKSVKLCLSDKIILCYLITKSNPNADNHAWPGQDAIGEALGLNRSTVTMSIARLQKLELISVEAAYKCRANGYKVSIDKIKDLLNINESRIRETAPMPSSSPPLAPSTKRRQDMTIEERTIFDRAESERRLMEDYERLDFANGRKTAMPVKDEDRGETIRKRVREIYKMVEHRSANKDRAEFSSEQIKRKLEDDYGWSPVPWTVTEITRLLESERGDELFADFKVWLRVKPVVDGFPALRLPPEELEY